MNILIFISCLALMYHNDFISTALTNDTSNQKYKLKRARKMLLRNITDFHYKVKPASLLQQDRTLHKKNTNAISDINTSDFLVAKNLSAAELFSFSATNKSVRIFAEVEIMRKLRRFSPYLIFEEDWFSYVVFKVLDDNGLSDLTLEDPRTRDLVTLMVLKYAFRDYTKVKVPQYIHLGIISFFFEMVYGKDIRMPIDNEAQIIHFLGEMVQIYDLPKALAYFISVLQLPKEDRMFVNMPKQVYNDNACKLLQFLSLKPSLDEHIEFYNESNNLSTYDDAQVYLLKQRILMTPMEEIGWFNNLTDLIRPCTSTVIDCFPEHNDLSFLCDDLWIGPVLHRKFGIQSDDPLNNYMWSIDYNHPFSFGDFRQLSGGVYNPENFFKMNISYILLLDIVGEISEGRNGFYRKISLNTNEVNEMLLAEHLAPRQLFLCLLHLRIEDFLMLPRQLEMIKLTFDHLFPKDYPFIPLLALGENVKAFKKQIRGKFELNVTYKFGANPFESENSSGIQYSFDNEHWQRLIFDRIKTYDEIFFKLGSVKNVTMTFLEILEFLNDSEISETYI